jgi:outer membrane protein
MRISSKIVLPAVLILGALTLAGSTARAQGLKIGFIDDEKIKDSYQAWVRAQEQWEIERKAWDDEATTKQNELQDMIDEFDKQKLILSEDKRKEREAAIRAKRDALDAYTRQIYGPGGTAEQKQMELIGPLLDRVNKAIQLVAEEENYDVVFTLQSGLGYIKEIYDITDKVLNKLETLED